MAVVIRDVILSLMMGLAGKIFFETFAPERQWRHRWVKYTVVPAFTAGFLIMAVSEIPPYALQPVRLTLLAAVMAQIYFQIKVGRNLILSVTFCSIYWILSLLIVSVFAAFSLLETRRAQELAETVTGIVHLCLTLIFYFRYKEHARGATGLKWGKFILFPLLSIIVVMAIGSMPWDGGNANLAAALGFSIINVCIFYFAAKMLDKEEEMQRLRLMQERMQNQMSMYRSMQKSYEQQRRYLHDYKNQLQCIQGLLEAGQIRETLAYISGLTGSLKKNLDHVNTNHTVVNVVLNRKYQEAYEKGIAMTMAVNDLSGLTMDEEEIVTLLVNLLDNAVEACEKLDNNRVIQFKMMLEEGQLILSVRNPVREPVRIEGNAIVTSKKDMSRHGIGLLNVDAVIRKNKGMGILKCENGWFYFSAMIPVLQ